MNDDLLYLGHMLDMARKARSFVEGKTRAEYDEDEILRLALTYLLQTIGEAARASVCCLMPTGRVFSRSNSRWNLMSSSGLST